MKRITATLLLIAILFSISSPTQAAAITAPTISPLYSSSGNMVADIAITSTGYANISITVTCESDVDTISLITYLEKYNYGMWTRVSIGTANNEWTYLKNGCSLCKTYCYALPSSGQYRVVSLVTLNGDTANTVTVTDYTSY